VQHPDEVEALILHSCTVEGTAWQPALFNVLPSEDWEFFLYSIAPRGFSREELQKRVNEFKRTVTQENWNLWMQALSRSSVEDYLPRLHIPTLALHPNELPALPVEEPMRLAAMLPHGRFALTG